MSDNPGSASHRALLKSKSIGIRRIAKQQHPTQTASSQATRHSSTLNSLRRSLIIASGPVSFANSSSLPPLDGFRNGRADVPIHRISAAQLPTRVLSRIASRRITFIAPPAQRSSNLDSQTFRSPLKSSLNLIFPRVRSRHPISLLTDLDLALCTDCPAGYRVIKGNTIFLLSHSERSLLASGRTQTACFSLQPNLSDDTLRKRCRF